MLCLLAVQLKVHTHTQERGCNQLRPIRKAHRQTCILLCGNSFYVHFQCPYCGPMQNNWGNSGCQHPLLWCSPLQIALWRNEHPKASSGARQQSHSLTSPDVQQWRLWPNCSRGESHQSRSLLHSLMYIHLLPPLFSNCPSLPTQPQSTRETDCRGSFILQTPCCTEFAAPQWPRDNSNKLGNSKTLPLQTKKFQRAV